MSQSRKRQKRRRNSSEWSYGKIATEDSPTQSMRVLFDTRWLVWIAVILFPGSNAYLNTGSALLSRFHVVQDSRRHDSRTQPMQFFQNRSTCRSPLLVAKGGEPSDRTTTPQRNAAPRKGPPRKLNKRPSRDNDISVAIATNKKLIACETPLDVLALLASIPDAMTKPAGGQTLNSVNFSTAVHRIARHLQYTRDDRARTLSDPRFALFLCSLSEAFVGYQDPSSETKKKQLSIAFNSRECSNIAWALAKLRLAPPKSTLDVNLEETVLEELVQTSCRVRELVLEAARNRNSQQQQKNWIPALSTMAGQLLDSIAVSILKSKTVFNTQEMANLLWAFATSQRADERVFQHIASKLVQDGFKQQPKPQELSNSVWAFATAQIHGESESNLIRHVADILDKRPEFVGEFIAQELSNTAWGIATIVSLKRGSGSHSYSPEELEKEDRVVLRILRHIARAITVRADEFKSQELSNTAWAFATLGFGMSESESSASVLNNYVFLRTDDMAGDRQLMANALDAVAQAAIPKLPKFRSQELNNIAWAFARLERKESTALYKGIGRQFGFPRRQITGQDIGTTLWAFATVEYFDEDVYRMIASRLTVDRANQFKPQELSNSVWALATAGVIPKYLDAFETSLIPPTKRSSLADMSDDPVTLCFAAASNELMRRPQQFKSQEIKDVMWSFSKVGMRHPRLFKTIAEHLVGSESEPVPQGRIHIGRGLDEFSPQGIGNLSWSYAKQAQLATQAAERIASYTREKTGRLAVYSTICVDVGESLVRRLFNAFADADLRKHAFVGYQDPSSETKKKQLSIAFNSRECSNIAWALAKLRLAPPKSTLDVNLEETVLEELVQTSCRVRELVLEAARNRNSQQQQKNWIPALSTMAGQLLDSIAVSILKSKTVFNTQEMANLLWAFATSQRADERVFQHIASKLVQDGFKQQPKPQELSNSVWAFATAQIHGESESNLIRHVADILDKRPEFVGEFIAQELSNTAWGIATIVSLKRGSGSHSYSPEELEKEDRVVLRILRHIARAITVRADEFKSQELSNTAWAFATLGFGMSESESSASVLNNYVFLRTDDMAGDRQLMANALDAVAQAAIPKLPKFRSQELNNIAWAFARLERKESTALYKGIGRQFGFPRRQITGQDIGTTLWAFATVEYFDEDVYRMIASRLTVDRANQFKPQELSNSVWALATAGVIPKYLDAFETSLIPPTKRSSLADMSDDPVTLCFAAASNELMRRPQQFKSQEIKDVMWSFSKVGMRHPRLFKTIAEHLVGSESEPVPQGRIHIGRGLDEFSPQGIGNLSWSYAKQAQLATQAAERIASYTREKTGRLAVYSTICVDVGESLVRRLFNAFADADLRKHDGLSKLKAQDMSNTIWAFAVLGLRHGPFFDALSCQVVRRLSATSRGAAFKGQELANIIWASASLGHDISDILHVAAPYMAKMCSRGGIVRAETIAKHFKRQELANIAWSCAVEGYYDAGFLRLLYTGLVGRDDECDPDYLRKVYGDGGLQRQATMSLLYVQLAMDLEYPENDLILPEGFPDGWDLVGESGEIEDMLEMLSSMLTLSTSKIQKDVSTALDRVGFEHVQEHVITMKDLVQNHGVQLPSQPLEILSIDVANVDDKIGVEVDGPAHFISVLDTWSPQEPASGFTRVSNNKLEFQFKWDNRQQKNGSTSLKERLLRKLGWTVLHVPFWEWYAFNGDSAKEEEYCRNMLGSRLEDNAIS